MLAIHSGKVPLHGVAYTSQGGRPENQDDFGFTDTPLGFLLVVCDGMGGGPGGKTASLIAKNVIARTLLDSDPRLSRQQTLQTAVGNAQQALMEKTRETPALAGMGSTVVAVLVNSRSAVVAHAGDSRCYRFRGKRMLYRSQDHSLVAELVRNKVMTEEQARTSPQSNVITRGLGNVTNNVPEIEEIPYKKGDRIILCTDGVWGIMPEHELKERLTAAAEESLVVGELATYIDTLGRASGGTYDNHTLAMIVMDVDSELKDKLSVGLLVSSLHLPSLNLPSLRLIDEKHVRIAAVSLAAVCVAGVVVLAVYKCSSTEKPTESLHLPSGGGYYQSPTEPDGPEETPGEVELPIEMDDSMRAVFDSLFKQRQEELPDTLRGDTTKVDTNIVKQLPDTAKTDNLQVICQKIINRLDSMKTSKGKSVEETAKKKDEALKNVESLLEELRSACPGQHAKDVEWISEYIKNNRRTLVAVAKEKTPQGYESTRQAKKCMDNVITKTKELKGKLK